MQTELVSPSRTESVCTQVLLLYPVKATQMITQQYQEKSGRSFLFDLTFITFLQDESIKGVKLCLYFVFQHLK